jgi:hypothetical protein
MRQRDIKELFEEAKEIFQKKEKVTLYEIDTEVKRRITIAILKGDRDEEKEIATAISSFIFWTTHPDRDASSWQFGWKVLCGWSSIGEISKILAKNVPVANELLEIKRRDGAKKYSWK